MRLMPTRDARGLSKTVTVTVTAARLGAPTRAPRELSARPPDPALPSRWRWALSVALAVGLPMLLGWAAQRLGPGPHAPVRIELALQTVGGPAGPAAAGAHRAPIAAPGNALRDNRAFAISAGSNAPAAARGKAATSFQPSPLPVAAPRPDPAPMPEPAAAAAPAPALPEVRDSRHPLAAAAVSPDFIAAQPGSTPSGRGNIGAESSTSPSAGGTGAPALGARGMAGARQTVRPEELDSGFGLAVPVRLPYPPAALASGQAGQARIEMEIEPSGQVARVTVLDETAGWGFGDAARQGYGGARFTPPTVKARPVRVLLRKTIEFLP